MVSGGVSGSILEVDNNRVLRSAFYQLYCMVALLVSNTIK